MSLEFQMMIELGINHNKLCGWQTTFVSVTRKQMFTISTLNQTNLGVFYDKKFIC